MVPAPARSGSMPLYRLIWQQIEEAGFFNNKILIRMKTKPVNPITKKQLFKQLINTVELIGWQIAVTKLEPDDNIQGLIIGTPEYIQNVLTQNNTNETH